MVPAVGAIFIMDVTCDSSTLRYLNKGQLEFGKNTCEDLLLITGEIAAGLLLDDLQVVDEHSGGIKVHLGFTRGGMSHLPKAEGCLLGIHHDEFDETLGEVCGVCCLLDFSHGNGLVWVD